MSDEPRKLDDTWLGQAKADGWHMNEVTMPGVSDDTWRAAGQPRWPVWQFAIAMGLIPLSFVMWWLGLEGVWRSDTPPPIDPNPGWTLMSTAILILSPAVALAGVIWILVLATLQVLAAFKFRTRIAK